jgi:hypothetical protein
MVHHQGKIVKQDRTGQDRTRTIVLIIISGESFRVRIIPYLLLLNFISPTLARSRDLRNDKYVSNHTSQQRFLLENVREHVELANSIFNLLY